MCSTSHHHGDDAGGSECVHMDWLIFAIEGRIKESIDMMDRRSFVRSLFLAGGAIATGAALLPRGAEAASLLDTLKDIEARLPKPSIPISRTPGRAGSTGRDCAPPPPFPPPPARVRDTDWTAWAYPAGLPLPLINGRLTKMGLQPALQPFSFRLRIALPRGPFAARSPPFAHRLVRITARHLRPCAGPLQGGSSQKSATPEMARKCNSNPTGALPRSLSMSLTMPGPSGDRMANTANSLTPSRDDFAAMLDSSFGQSDAYEGSVVKGNRRRD